MIFLPDTNAWIQVLRHPQTPLALRLERVARRERVWLADIVRAELLYGVLHSREPGRRMPQLQTLFRSFRAAPFDSVAADHHGRVRQHLAAAGTPIGPNDLCIAATALAHGCTLVTHNTWEFRRVPGLRVEDWQAEEQGPA